MFELKPDFEDVSNRYEAWWDCAILDRPPVSMAFSLPKAERQAYPKTTHETLRDRWPDTEFVVSSAEVRLRNTVNLSFRRKPESSKFKYFWIPDQVRDDGNETFYELINLEP